MTPQIFRLELVLYSGQSKMRDLIGSREFVVKSTYVANDVMSLKVLRAQIITAKTFKNSCNFVRDNQYQNNV